MKPLFSAGPNDSASRNSDYFTQLGLFQKPSSYEAFAPTIGRWLLTSSSHRLSAHIISSTPMKTAQQSAADLTSSTRRPPVHIISTTSIIAQLINVCSKHGFLGGKIHVQGRRSRYGHYGFDRSTFSLAYRGYSTPPTSAIRRPFWVAKRQHVSTQSPKRKQLGTCTFSIVTINKRRQLKCTNFAELSYQNTQATRNAISHRYPLYIFATQNGGCFRILPLTLNFAP